MSRSLPVNIYLPLVDVTKEVGGGVRVDLPTPVISTSHSVALLARRPDKVPLPNRPQAGRNTASALLPSAP